ncbi:hypothetical protein BH20ACT15_BH20ACT15_02970 [soil metagenome]
MHPRHTITRILSTTLITAGLVVLLDAGTTLLWQEPVSAAYGTLQQDRAADELADLESSFVADAEGATTDTGRAKVLAKKFASEISKGDAIGRIKIDSIGVSFVLLNGTDTATLQTGPGRYPQTPLPGLGSTTGIAGHRTTYQAPFRKINEIDKGDEIRVEMPYAAFTYTVEKSKIVDPSDVQILDPVGYDRVVLTACHPLYSAAQRYAVFGKLSDVQTFAVDSDGRWTAP